MRNVWVALAALAAVCGGQNIDCPSSCYCDHQQSVNCVGDNLWGFPDELPTQTKALEMRNYVVVVLTYDKVKAFRNMTELKVTQSNIHAVENGTFRDTRSLLKLDLSQNAISEVTAATFEGLRLLKHLDLSSNNLSSCKGAFTALGQLEQLTLRNNKLTSLGPTVLHGLTRLQYLNLDSNLISHIDISAFLSLTSLAHLILSKNPLSGLSRLEFFGTQLQYIDVSAVGLRQVPQSLTQYVRDLRLAKNNLSTLRRGDFDSYPYLGLLVLDDCGIISVEEDTLGRHEHLMRLWMNGNELTSVPSSLPPSLRALYLEENNIKALKRDDFQRLTSMEHLFLRRNRIESIADCTFCGMSSLKYLDLQDNQINTLSRDSFSGLISLETLILSHNPIIRISVAAFSPFTSLQELQMSRMSVKPSLPDSLFDALSMVDSLDLSDSPQLVDRFLTSGRLLHGVRNVKQLNLQHNHLSSLRPDLPTLLSKLQLVKLAGNWWNCSDPDILWLTDWMSSGRVQFFNPYSVQCRSPPRLRFKSVALLKESDFATVEVETSARTLVTARSEESTTDAFTTQPRRFTREQTKIRESSSSHALPLTTTGDMALSARTDESTTNPSIPASAVSSTTDIPTARTTPATSPTSLPPSTLSSASTFSGLTKPSSTSLPPVSTPTTSRSTQISLSPATSTILLVPAVVTQRTWTAAAAIETGIGSAALPDPEDTLLPDLQRVSYVPSGRRGTMVAIFTSMAAAVGIVLLVLVGTICMWHYRRVSVYPFIRRRRSSSIQYSQQKDEVSILQEGCCSEDTNGGENRGLSNTLYFLECQDNLGDPSRPRPNSLVAQSGIDACPRAVSDAWATPSPEAENRW